MLQFWVSWYETTSKDDPRPVYKGRRPPLLRHWVSGYRGDDSAPTICVQIFARSRDDAEKRINKYWPGEKEWRFFESKPMGFTPGDRFPNSLLAGGTLYSEEEAEFTIREEG